MKKVKKGMTLLEIVVALAIIAIMIIPLMNSLLTAVRTNKKGEEVQDAKLLGQQVIENLRVQDIIKEGTIAQVGFDSELGVGNSEQKGFEIKLDSLIEATDTSKGYFPVSMSTEVDGFTIEGKIYEEEVKEINADLEDDEYFNKPLAGLIVVKGEDIYYIKNLPKEEVIEGTNPDGTSNLVYKNTMKEVFKSSKKEDFKKREKDTSKIKVEFETVRNESNGRKTYNIKLDDAEFVSDNSYALGIYIVEEATKTFDLINNSDRTQDILVFRDPSISTKAGCLEGSDWTGISEFNKYTNIVVDAKSGSSGLYTAELEVKKDNETVERIESQFYLGE
ncbi:MAG: prepilin-type N-terminal cleavage/methylation domain-containing protein [Sarcina sp.]